MTVSLAPCTQLIALSLGNLVKEKGVHLWKPFPPPPPPQKSSLPSALLATISKRWFRLSSLFRFFVSGNLGNICFFLIERAIFSQLSQLTSVPEFVNKYMETVSFFIGYLLQIVTQHFIHALLVYGLETIDTREKYFKTLLGQFYAYGISLFGSTSLNLLLIQYGIDKTIAFFSTMVIFACINYYFIGWLVKRAVISSNHDNTLRPAKSSSTKKATTKSSKWNNHKPSIQQRQRASSFQSRKKSFPSKSRAEDIRKIRRGGAFLLLPTDNPKDTFSGFLVSSPEHLHKIILEMEMPIDMDSVNDS